MIQYFWEGLRPSVRAYLDTRGRDLDSWKEAVEKAVNAEVKAMLQSFSNTREMDSRCPWGNRPAKKEEKDSRKNNYTNSALADISSKKQSSSTQQTSSANPKKDQDQQRGSWRHGRQGQDRDSPATGVNIVSKKEKKNITQVKCYTCHWKGHYANKCPWNPKEESKN